MPKCSARREDKSIAGDDSTSTARREVNQKASVADPKAIFFHFFPLDPSVFQVASPAAKASKSLVQSSRDHWWPPKQGGATARADPAAAQVPSQA